MLYQLHWQNRDNLRQTEFVAQGDFSIPDELHAWARELIERRGNEMPKNWCPLICSQESEYFVMAPRD